MVDGTHAGTSSSSSPSSTLCLREALDYRLHSITEEAGMSDLRIKEGLTLSLQGLEGSMRSVPIMAEEWNRCVDRQNTGHQKNRTLLLKAAKWWLDWKYQEISQLLAGSSAQLR